MTKLIVKRAFFLTYTVVLKKTLCLEEVGVVNNLLMQYISISESSTSSTSNSLFLMELRDRLMQKLFLDYPNLPSLKRYPL